jgi:hypothetical protein
MNLTLEQIIKIVLAIGGVVLFLFAIYIIVFRILLPNNLAENQAKGTLGDIVSNLNDLQPGESVKLTIVAPSGWTIIFFSDKEKSLRGFDKPVSFTFKNALCICGSSCKKEICREINKPLLMDGKEDNPFFFKIQKKDFNVTDMPSYYKIKEVV